MSAADGLASVDVPRGAYLDDEAAMNPYTATDLIAASDRALAACGRGVIADAAPPIARPLQFSLNQTQAGPVFA